MTQSGWANWTRRVTQSFEGWHSRSQKVCHGEDHSTSHEPFECSAFPLEQHCSNFGLYPIICKLAKNIPISQVQLLLYNGRAEKSDTGTSVVHHGCIDTRMLDDGLTRKRGVSGKGNCDACGTGSRTASVRVRRFVG